MTNKKTSKNGDGTDKDHRESHKHMPVNLSCVFETGADLILPTNRQNGKYAALEDLLILANENNELSYPLVGLSRARLNDKLTGRKSINYTQMENLAVLYGVPAGVLLLISRIMAEIQAGNQENLTALFDGLIDLKKSIRKQGNQIENRIPSKSYEHSMYLAEIFLNAYKKRGLKGKGPDFIKETDKDSTT